ncbi:hypothetical protein Y032_0004g2018 [Ancylostoma ceylanicum]|nr:hypothetical protein Y032_0004g2018 [Ancylostoma ceylanicum]
MNSTFLLLLLLVVDVFANNITSRIKNSTTESEQVLLSNGTFVSKDKYKIVWGLWAFGAVYGIIALATSIYQGIIQWG